MSTSASSIRNDVVDVQSPEGFRNKGKLQPGRNDPTRAPLTPKVQRNIRGHQKHGEYLEVNEHSWGSSASTQAPPVLSPSTFEIEADEVSRRSSSREWVFSTPLGLGRPDGLSGGFYELMQRLGEIRASLAHKFLTKSMDDCEQSLSSLNEALDSLQSIPRPQGWTPEDDDGLHVLAADSTTHAVVHLGYEKSELTRDVQFLRGGDAKVLELLRQHHERIMSTGVSWMESQFPSWEDSVNRALQVMHDAGATNVATLPFRNFITDRDGTVNNYCDRYASSQQSLYNAVWIGNFARKCTENSLFVTAAPLGGRPNTFGLVELCTMPPGIVTYSGSKGREYYDHYQKRVAEIEPLPLHVQEALDTLYRRLLELCGEARNHVFLGLGSGLQRKCGEITIARNTPSKTVKDSESRRFMAEVQQVMSEIDPESIIFDLRDTGTDLEIFPRMIDGRPSFDKGSGVVSLNAQLDLEIGAGPNLVCGDTPSDLPMIQATLNLIPKRPASNLAVLFVITPEQHEKTPQLAEQVSSLCSEHGAHYAILPSPDVLVSSLAEYTRRMRKL